MSSKHSHKRILKKQMLLGVAFILLVYDVHISDAYSHSVSWGFLWNRILPLQNVENVVPWNINTVPHHLPLPRDAISQNKDPLEAFLKAVLSQNAPLHIRSSIATVTRTTDATKAFSDAAVTRATDQPRISSKATIPVTTFAPTLSPKAADLHSTPLSTLFSKEEHEGLTSTTKTISLDDTPGHQKDVNVTKDSTQQENATVAEDIDQRGNVTVEKSVNKVKSGEDIIRPINATNPDDVNNRPKQENFTAVLDVNNTEENVTTADINKQGNVTGAEDVDQENTTFGGDVNRHEKASVTEDVSRQENVSTTNVNQQENATKSVDAKKQENVTATESVDQQENKPVAEAVIQNSGRNEKHLSSSILQLIAEKFFEGNQTLSLKKLVSSLQSLTEESTSSCFNDTAFLLESVIQNEEWALEFVDASGKPNPNLSRYRLHFVGDYHFCRSLVSERSNKPFRGKYVVWNMLIEAKLVELRVIKPVLLWGVCMPDTCSEQENKIIANKAIQAFGFNEILRSVRAEIHSDHRDASPATYLAILVICVFGLLMISGTAYDIVYLQWPHWKEQWEEEQEVQSANGGNGVIWNGQEKMAVPAVQHHTSTTHGSKIVSKSANNDRNILISLHSGGKVSKVRPPIEDYGSFAEKELLSASRELSLQEKLLQALLAFSVYTNGKKLLHISQPPGSISCLHGIRCLSMSWLLIGQLCFMPLGKGLYYNVPAEFRTFLQHWTFDVASNAYVCVDTFFTLSGLLVCYVTVREMEKKGWKLNWGSFYFHRFWRLTPPYILTLLLVVGLQQYCGEGPLWEPTQPADKHKCEKYWWTNLLYINNFFSTDKLCFAHSWYLSVNMQFFLVSPLLIIPFYFNPKLGLGSSAFFLLLQLISTSITQAHYKFSTAPVLNLVDDYPSYFRHYYAAPWCRIGPYVIGIMTGYLLATKRDKIKLNRYRATAGWTVATAVALAVTYGLHPHIEDVGQHNMPAAAAAFYNIFAGTAWAAAVCWMVVACAVGWGGFVNSFLSWSPFLVLGRLVYMVYLIHESILEIYFENQPRQIYFTGFNFALTLIGLTVVCFAGAFVLALAFELPMVCLERIFLPKRRKD